VVIAVVAITQSRGRNLGVIAARCPGRAAIVVTDDRCKLPCGTIVVTSRGDGNDHRLRSKQCSAGLL